MAWEDLLTGAEISVSPVEEVQSQGAEPAIQPVAAVTTMDLSIQGTATSSACGTVDADLTLTANIVNDSTCFTIAANNVVLNGAGYAITGNGSYSYGIDLDSYDNITIKNFGGINNFSTAIGDNIGFDTGQNSTFFNNTITTVRDKSVAVGILGIDLRNSVGMNISSNTIYLFGNNSGIGSPTGVAISLLTTNFSVISSNVINNSVEASGIGIVLDTSSNWNNVTDNIITTGDQGGRGISLKRYGASQNDGNRIIANNITVYNNDGRGISLEESWNNTIQSNNVTINGNSSLSGDSTGIRLSNSSFNELSSNTIITKGKVSSGLSLSNSYGTPSHNNNITSNTIIVSGNNSQNLVIQRSNNNLVSSNNLTSYSNFTSPNGAALVLNGANFTLVTSNVITNWNSSTYGLQLLSSAYYNNITFNNVTSYAFSSIYVSGGNNNNVSANIVSIYSNLTSGNQGAIYVENSNFTSVVSNTISAYQVTTGCDACASGIQFNNVNNSVISYNVITSWNVSANGLRLEFGSTLNNLSGNNITVYGKQASGILIVASLNNLLSNNNITIRSNNSGYVNKGGITLEDSNYSLILENTIVSWNDTTPGIYLTGSIFNNFTSNAVTTFGPNANAFYLKDSGCNGNILSSNNFTANRTAEIGDDSGSAATNYLIYNNSFGKVEWTNSSFLQDLDLADNNGLGIGLGLNLFIGNNTAALNTSAFTTDLSINSSANITFYGIGLNSVEGIRKAADYFTNSTNVSTLGSGCADCKKLSYVGGTLIFNTTSFSSFTGAQDVASPNSSNYAISANSTYVNLTVILTATVQDDLLVDTVFFTIQPFGNITASVSGTTATVTCNATNACNTTAIKSYNWTSVWLNDTAGNTSSTALTLQFNITATPVLNVTLVTPNANANFNRHQFNAFTINVSCTINDCGAVNISLDPVNVTGSLEATPISIADPSGTVFSSSALGSTGEIYTNHYFGFTAGIFANGTCWQITTGADAASCLGVGAANLPCVVVSPNLTMASSGDSFEVWADQTECQNSVVLGPKKSGLVSMANGALPFYTNTTNPYNISLNVNQSVLVTWHVNATGNLSSNHTFFAYANLTSTMSISARSISINITIVNATANTIPNTARVVINSSSLTNTTTENLACYANITDADGGNVYANFTWYNNTVSYLSGRSSAFTQNTIGLVSTLGSGNTTKTENWTCSVNAYDGTDYETDWNNATLTIKTLCGTVTASTALTENITVTGSCLTLGASNIVIDGAGYVLTGNGSGIGINLTGFNNVTLKNFNGINNFSAGIYFSNAVNSTIFNNSVVSSGTGSYGFYLAFSNRSNISSNSLNTSTAYGIYLQDSDNNTFTTNQVNSSNASEIYVDENSTNNAFTNLILLGDANLASASLMGISLDVNITPPADPSGKQNLTDYLTITNNTAQGFIDFNLSYTSNDTSGITESTIRIYRYSGSSWAVSSASTVDTANKIVSSGNLSSFSLFAPFGDVPSTATVTTTTTTGGGGGNGQNCPAGQNLTNGRCQPINVSTEEEPAEPIEFPEEEVSQLPEQFPANISTEKPELIILGEGLYEQIASFFDSYRYYVAGFVLFIILLILVLYLVPRLSLAKNKAILTVKAPPLEPAALGQRKKQPWSKRQELAEQLEQVNLRIEEVKADKVEEKVEVLPFDERLDLLNQKIKQLKQEAAAPETAVQKIKLKPEFISRIKAKLLEQELQEVSNKAQGYVKPSVAPKSARLKPNKFTAELAKVEEGIKQLQQEKPTAPETAAQKIKPKPEFISRIKAKLLEQELQEVSNKAQGYARPKIIIKPAGLKIKKLAAELAEVAGELEHLDETGKKVRVVTVLPSTSGHASSSAAERQRLSERLEQTNQLLGKPIIISAPKKDYGPELAEVDQKLANLDQLARPRKPVRIKTYPAFKPAKKQVLRKMPKPQINRRRLARLKAELAQVEEEMSKIR